MRIAYVTMRFPTPSETFASTDVHALTRLGDVVTVIGLRPAHARHAELMAERSLESVAVCSLSLSRALRGLGLAVVRPAWTWSMLLWIFRWTWLRPTHTVRSLLLLPSALVAFDDVRRGGFTVAHLFWGHYPAMVGHLLERFAPEVVRSIFLGAYDLAMGYGGSAPVARHADTVWTHARVNVPDIERLGVPAGTVRVAYRGVDASQLEAVARRYAGERVPRRIVTVARLIASKGLRDVIRAFAVLRNRVPQATLCIVGEGPEQATLEELARALGVGEAIEFLGHLPHADALAAMACSEVFVLLSTKPGERLPNAVKEAMALGCVCVVTATPGIDELVEHERTGFVLESTEPESVAGWLQHALTLGPERGTLQEAAVQRIRESFSVLATMVRYREAWQAAQVREGRRRA